MIILLAIAGYWFAQLSGIPYEILKYSHKIPRLFMYVLRHLDCTKCVCFWLGLIYTESVLLAIICSFMGIVLSRIYYKFLS